MPRQRHPWGSTPRQPPCLRRPHRSSCGQPSSTTTPAHRTAARCRAWTPAQAARQTHRPSKLQAPALRLSPGNPSHGAGAGCFRPSVARRGVSMAVGGLHSAGLPTGARAAQPLLTPRSPDKLLPCRCSSASCGRAVLPPQLPGSPPVSWLSLKSRSMRLALVQLAGSGPVNRLPPRSIRWVARDSRPLGSGAPAGQAGGCAGTLVVWSAQNARASNLAIFPH